jgi:hypothetical protein
MDVVLDIKQVFINLKDKVDMEKQIVPCPNCNYPLSRKQVIKRQCPTCGTDIQTYDY